jgi:hypothetical protein
MTTTYLFASVLACVIAVLLLCLGGWPRHRVAFAIALVSLGALLLAWGHR